MKFTLNTVIAFFLLSLVFYPNIEEAKEDDQIEISLIYTLNTFHNVKKEDAHAVAQILANHLNKNNNYKYVYKAFTLDGLNEIEKVAGNNFDCIILTTEEYLELKNKIPLLPFATNYSEGNIGYRYYLVVNKSSGIKDITQLKNENINILASNGQKAPYLWLDKLLNDKKLPTYKTFFKSVHEDYKATNVLLPVIFNKVKACIVTEVSLNLLSELNPSIRKNCQILNLSDYLLLGMCCLNNNKKHSKVFNLLQEIILNLDKEEYGRQMLHLFNADKLVPYKEEYLQNYIELYEK